MTLTREEFVQIATTMFGGHLSLHAEQIVKAIIDNELSEEPLHMSIGKFRRVQGFNPMIAYVIAIIILIRSCNGITCDIVCVSNSQRLAEIVISKVYSFMAKIPEFINNDKYSVRNSNRLVHEQFSLTCEPVSARHLAINGNLLVCDEHVLTEDIAWHNPNYSV